MKQDELAERHSELIEKKRLYYKKVKEFQDECKKNEILTRKIQQGQS